MPTLRLKNCEIEGDLAASVLDIAQEVGDATRELINDLDGISLQASEVGQINNLLDQLALQAPTPQSPDTIALSIGIPTVNAPTEEMEERIEQLGLVVLRGVAWVPNGSGNIEAFRRLYFALGADSSRMLSFVQGQDPLVVVQTRLTVKKLPLSSVSWTVPLAREALSNPAIEQIYTAADNNQYCIVPSFLGTNLSREQARLQYGVPEREILTQVFWLREVRQDAGTVSSLQGYGLTAQEVSAALSGQRLLEVRPTAADQYRVDAGVETSKAIAQLRLLQGRFSLLDTPSKLSLKFEALASTDAAREQWWGLQRAVRFYSTVLERPEDLSDFLSKHPQEDLDYLFGTRRTVRGIAFQADLATLLRSIRQVLSVQASNTTVSTLLVNREALLLDHDIDTANASLCRNECAVNLLSGTDVRYDSIVTAISCLQGSLEQEPAPVPRTVPQIGYVSFDSPADFLMGSLDFTLSLGIDDSIAELEKAILESGVVTGTTKAVLAITSVLRDAQNGIDQVFDHYRDVVERDLAHLNEMMSKYSSFVGTVAIDSSVLKCSLGYSLDADIPALTELQGLIETLRRKLKNVLAKLAQAVAKMLDKILCTPLNLLNGLINKAESFLPEFCQVARVSLPAAIEAAMVELRQKFDMQNSTVQAFSRDLIRVSASLQGAPAKLEQFKQGLACESQANNRFFKALNVSVGSSQLTGALANPAAVVANTVNRLTPGF
jgi:hypothetical protein